MTRPLKRILNRSEATAHDELQQIAEDYGYGVHIKMRLADIFPIEGSAIDSELYSFALMSHFDFVVSGEQHEPLFAVEFDGPLHRDEDQRQRDAKKDALCDLFDFPILRINDRHLAAKYNKATLLRWIVSAWELQKAFDVAQADGQIPPDESFDPIFLWHQGSTVEEVHPHWIALKARRHLQQLKEQGQIPSPYTCGFVGTDAEDNYRGIEWIDVDGDRVVCVESGMRAQRFPLYLGELFDELMTVLLYEELLRFLDTGEGSVEPQTVSDRLTQLKKSYKFAGSHGGPTKVKFSLSLAEGKWI